MSNPSNRLAKFRSYSYYHVLVMCDCTATADALTQSQDIGIWEHATSQTAATDDRAQTRNLGRYAPKQLPESGRYIVLINGSQDANYVITSAKWYTGTAASAVPGDRATSIAVEGSLQISEPKGIAFLDQVVQCSIALGVDAAQVVFVLKTFFVGFAFDSAQGDYPELIADVPPINLIAYDVVGSFTEQGGTYEMQFVAVAHGAARLPQYSKSVNAMNVTAGNSLEQTFSKLQNVINQSYSQYFDSVVSQIQATDAPQVDKDAVIGSLRRVNYVIDVGPDYRDTNGNIKYTVSNQSQQFKNTSGCGDAAQITFPTSTSIESAISTIMLMCPQVQSDMSQGDTSTKIKYEYKIHTALESKPALNSTDGSFEYTVYYRVERFMVPKTIAFDSAFQALSEDDAVLRQSEHYDTVRRNLIEFDYMYTGKNIDILEFDMKVNMGMAYLQTATLANTFKSQLERVGHRDMQASTQDVNAQSTRFGGAIVQTPVFFGTQLRTPNLLNQQNTSSAIQSAYTMTKHASLEVAEASMKIIGNEKLLGSTSITTSSEHVIRSGGRVPETNTPDSSDFKDWSIVPAFVKVNIKMPRENDDFALFTGQTTGDPEASGATDYAREFWFDGYYYAYGIEHSFDQGEFTQNLQMVGIPKKSAFDSTRENSTREVNLPLTAPKPFDNRVGCGPTTPSPTTASGTTAAAVPQTPPAGNTNPTTIADANTLNRNAASPADVRGWSKADPRVQAAIIDAAQRYGVDVVIMAQFAAKESSFNPRAHPPGSASSAAGLYQFLKATWNGLVSAGSVLGLSESTGLVTSPGKTPLSNDVRYDPALNAYGGAAFLRDNARAIGSKEAGDLYLAHFLGPATARRIINDVRTTGGNTLFSNVVGSATAANIAKANPTIVNSATTSLSIRNWAATSMAKLLTNQPTKAVPPPATPPRTADQPVASVQNCDVQSAKKDTTPCGPSTQKPEAAVKPTTTTQ